MNRRSFLALVGGAAFAEEPKAKPAVVACRDSRAGIVARPMPGDSVIHDAFVFPPVPAEQLRRLRDIEQEAFLSRFRMLAAEARRYG